MNQDLQLPLIGDPDFKPREGAIAQAHLAVRLRDEALQDCALLDEQAVALLDESNPASFEGSVALLLQQHRVFALEMPDLGLRYPAFQFRSDGTPWPVLAEVLPRLQSGFNPFDLLIWFNTPHPALAGDKPRTRLDEPDMIVAAARDSLEPIDFY